MQEQKGNEERLHVWRFCGDGCGKSLAGGEHNRDLGKVKTQGFKRRKKEVRFLLWYNERGYS